MSEIISYKDVESSIIEIRGEKVILDSDVAELYGVETKRVNEAINRNSDKFPEGYILSLDSKEWKDLKSLSVISNETDSLKSQNATSKRGGKNKLPKAFTEKGLYMLATILKSPAATQTTIAIVEAFAKLREFNRIMKHLPEVQDEEQQKALALRTGELVTDVFDGGTFNVVGDEVSFELNLPLVKVKRTVKREKRKEL